MAAGTMNSIMTIEMIIIQAHGRMKAAQKKANLRMQVSLIAIISRRSYHQGSSLSSQYSREQYRRWLVQKMQY
jgi:hypothetical protein